jgi:hypothetical protein
MRRSGLAVIAITLAALGAPTPARACSFALPTPHVVDPSLRMIDQVPPTLPGPIRYAVYRGPQRTACGGTSCDGNGTIDFATEASDDMTPPAQIGYRLRLEAGALPTGLTLPADAIVPAFGQLFLLWDSGASDGDEPIDFTLQVVAIDLAGNESAPQTVRIHDDPGGCAIGRGGASRGPAAWLAVAALVLAARPRSGVRSRAR